MDTINPPSVAHSPLPICYPRYRSLNKATKARIVSAPFSFSRTGKIFKPRGNFETTHFLRSRRKPRQQADGELSELGFMYRAASYGFGVARPYGDSHPYD